MLQFILTNLLLLSVGTVLYLLVRALPRLSEEDLKPAKRPFLERWITSGIPEKVDAVLNQYLGKFFRKLKVYLLRVDNYLTERLKKVNPQEGEKGITGQPKPKVDSFDKLKDNIER